jgi:hypothetical protein
MRMHLDRITMATVFALVFAFAMQALGSAQLGPTVHGAQITVANRSDMCAWITIYKATTLTSWSIETNGASRPQYVRPGASHTFQAVMPTALAIPTEIKVRAQLDRAANCSTKSSRVPDLSREMKGLTPRNPAYGMSFDATVSGFNGHYSLDLHRVSN